MSELHQHDRYAPHSHEVRADHLGVAFERQGFIRIPLAGLPASCPDCGTITGEWPFGIFGNVLSVHCPNCFAIVAPVRAVPA